MGTSPDDPVSTPRSWGPNEEPHRSLVRYMGLLKAVYHTKCRGWRRNAISKAHMSDIDFHTAVKYLAPDLSLQASSSAQHPLRAEIHRCVYMRACTHIICMYTYIGMYTCISRYRHRCIYNDAFVCTYTSICTCTHLGTHMYICMYNDTSIRTYTRKPCTYTYDCVGMCICQ